ncbi:ComEC/Rec2 family competence protein [Pedobacter xixiisoli]|uniref:Competence protein ComEC n=1 Tax=Pedobacter xixiisoli TaxID=1476464 RepID=A0A285ZSV5_9SPHI|nr:ComEC/Rec2 family competence protein [Pedobacter xixiisoli]SOD12718.1 competence protein ComEC [Pedobacter xixiisoli]
MIFRAEIVFVKILLPLIGGIILGYYLQNQQLLRVAAIVLASLSIAALLINTFYKKLKAWNYKKPIASLYYLLFFFLGIFLTLFHTNFLRKNYYAHKQYHQLKVWINSEPQQTNDILRFEVAVTDGYLNNVAEKCSGNLLIALKVDSLSPIHLSYGDELLILANYLPVEPPYNPAEFDFKQWLAAKNIYHQSFIRQDELIKLLESEGNPIIDYALKVRKQQVEIYRKLIHDDEAFAVASTLILGYRADLSKETLAAYSKTGTIHALSVSGMHVGIIYIMLNWLLSFLDKKNAGRVFKVILICSLIWYYSLLTGFSPSVLRSAIMLTAFILAKQFKRSSNSYNIVAFTAFGLLAYNPFLVWDVGFQLSFLAVFGLIYYQPKIYKWCYFKNKWLDKLWGTVAMSLAAQLATLPLSIYYFHQFPVYFIISNLFILIPITILMYVGIAILLLKVHFIAPAFEWLIVFINKGLKWISELPYAGITEIWLNKWQLLLLCLFMILLTIALIQYKKKYLLSSAIILLVIQVTFAYQKIMSTKQQELIFFSLRKNYAAAFIDGNESILLTDLNSTDRNFEFFVKPALDQKQVKTIQFINWDTDFQSQHFIKKDHQINYKGKQFLLIDEKFNAKKLSQKHSFDFLWMHNNPRQKMEFLKEEIEFSNLILDASNKDYIIAKFGQQADSLKVTVHALKKRKAVTLKFN